MSALDEELRWRQPEASKWRYILTREGDPAPLASLEWRSAWGTFATAMAHGEEWTFKRTGFRHPRVTVRRAGSEDDLAVFETNWQGGGTLTLPGGATFTWKAANMWYNRWSWLDARGVDVMHLVNKQGFVRQEATVEIAAGTRLPERDLLLTLGWYLLILTTQDAGAVAAAMD